MPKGTKVHSCVQKLKAKGKSESSAIAICQDSTKQSYQTGRRLVSVRDKGKDWHKKQYKKKG
jgi:hypothetical protein